MYFSDALLYAYINSSKNHVCILVLICCFHYSIRNCLVTLALLLALLDARFAPSRKDEISKVSVYYSLRLEHCY